MKLPALALLLVFALPSIASEQTRTVIGPTNQYLYDGSNALLAGDPEEGVRLTLLGLEFAANDRERVAGLSNLCAGYVMLDQLDTALGYCNQALALNERHWRSLSNRALIYVKLKRYDEAAADLDRGEAISPNARKIKDVRAMLLDATDPVEPTIIIDDRRQPLRDEDG